MESIYKLGELFEEISTLFNSVDIPKQIISLQNENNKLKEDLKELIEIHQNKCNELTQIKNKYDKEIGLKNNEIKQQKEECNRLTKVSLIQQYDKQVKEKNDYIKILECQLEKYKSSSKSQLPKVEEYVNTYIDKDNLDNIDTNIEIMESVQETNDSKNNELTNSELPISESNLEQTNDEHMEMNTKTKRKKIKKSQEPEEIEFDPDNFEDVNGYELIVYKGIYYLRDLETNELYDIKNNQPNQVIGLINSKGKVKFN